MSSPKISDEEIDQILMANITHQWRKVARVVAMTMRQIDPSLLSLFYLFRVIKPKVFMAGLVFHV